MKTFEVGEESSTREERMKVIREKHETEMKCITETCEKIMTIVDEVKIHLKNRDILLVNEKITKIGYLCLNMRKSEYKNGDVTSTRKIEPNSFAGSILIKLLKSNPEFIDNYPEYKDYI